MSQSLCAESHYLVSRLAYLLQSPRGETMSIQQISVIYSGAVVHIIVEVVTPMELLHKNKVLNSKERLWLACLFSYQ